MTVEPKEPTAMAIDCPVCEVPQIMQVVDRRARFIEEIEEPVEYTYVTCSGCSAPMLLMRSFFYDQTGGDFELRFHRIYPPMRRQLSFAIPIGVRRGYEEAVRCEEAKAWTATAVMVGTALEAICIEFDDSSTSIADGLRRMRDAGAISQELFEWGNGLRHLRNEGAHVAPTNVSAADAAFAVDFLQALVEILFDLRERFEAWQDDRAATP